MVWGPILALIYLMGVLVAFLHRIDQTSLGGQPMTYRDALIVLTWPFDLLAWAYVWVKSRL